MAVLRLVLDETSWTPKFYSRISLWYGDLFLYSLSAFLLLALSLFSLISGTFGKLKVFKLFAYNVFEIYEGCAFLRRDYFVGWVILRIAIFFLVHKIKNSKSIHFIHFCHTNGYKKRFLSAKESNNTQGYTQNNQPFQSECSPVVTIMCQQHGSFEIKVKGACERSLPYAYSTTFSANWCIRKVTHQKCTFLVR